MQKANDSGLWCEVILSFHENVEEEYELVDDKDEDDNDEEDESLSEVWDDTELWLDSDEPEYKLKSSSLAELGLQGIDETRCSVDGA